MTGPNMHFHLRRLVVDASTLGGAARTEPALHRAIIDALQAGPAGVPSASRVTPIEGVAHAVSSAAWNHPVVAGTVAAHSPRAARTGSDGGL